MEVMDLSTKPKHIIIRESMRDAIKKGDFEEDRKFPSENEICKLYNVNRGTVREAISALVHEGLLTRRHGAGTFVASTEVQGQKIKSFAVLAPDLSSPFISSIYNGIEGSLSEHGYHVILANSNENVAKELKNLQKFHKSGIEGIVTTPVHDEAKDYFNNYISCCEELMKDDISLVLADIYVPGLETDYVVTDNYKGGLIATRHLIELGHRRIAHIALERLSSTRERYLGYKAGLEEHGIIFEEKMVRTVHLKGPDPKGEKAKKEGYEAMRDLLKGESQPTAVFAVTDVVAAGAYKAVREVGFKVPEDFSIIGFNDEPTAIMNEVPLTTIGQPTYEMGTQAAQILIKRLNAKKGERCRIRLEPKLVVRASTGMNLQG